MKTRLVDRPAWKALAAHQAEIAEVRMRDLFATDPRRFARFSLQVGDLLLDYSKNRITAETLRLLCDLARDCGVEARRDAMFAGERINETEGRPVLHVALRNPAGKPIRVDGNDVMPDVTRVLERMGDFAEAVRGGAWRGYAGQPITDVVNIGIGGSDLGPLMACEALKHCAHADLRMHFVSNVDGSQIVETLAPLRPKTTLFIVASKTFTTAETLANARTARAWLLDDAPDESAVARHFVAVSTNEAAVREFGIAPENMFGFWDWVGGRYSLWSAIGLPIMVSLGRQRFAELLAGAHAMDEHFRSAPLEANLPAILGLLGIWYINFFDVASHAVLPYDQHLHRFPAYLQQLDMESNGKGVTLSGAPVAWQTSPVIWGEPGTNGQHAFFQLLHQGSGFIPVDFIAAVEPAYDVADHHTQLLANFLAQGEALMRGRSDAEVRAEMAARGVAAATIDRLAAHRVCPGNRPSNALLLRRLDPFALGQLIALYEHKVFVQGAVWGIDSFDQWGVELGKQLAGAILAELDGDDEVTAHDSSTNGLINHYKRLRRGQRRTAPAEAA